MDNSKPAFPQTIDDMGTMRSVTEGMSLREYYAGQAVIGLLMHRGLYWQGGSLENLNGFLPKELANISVAIADTMIAKINKGAQV